MKEFIVSSLLLEKNVASMLKRASLLIPPRAVSLASTFMRDATRFVTVFLKLFIEGSRIKTFALMGLSTICHLDGGEDLKSITPKAVNIFFARPSPSFPHPQLAIDLQQSSLRYISLSSLEPKVGGAR